MQCAHTIEKAKKKMWNTQKKTLKLTHMYKISIHRINLCQVNGGDRKKMGCTCNQHGIKTGQACEKKRLKGK